MTCCTLLFKGCDLAATAGLGVTTAGLGNPRHPVHVTDVYAAESRTPLVRELSADCFSVGLLLHCSPTRHRYSLAHSTAHMSSGQSTK